MLVNIHDRYAVWQLNRPDEENGTDETTMSELEKALTTLEASPDKLNCLMVRGDEKNFSCGLDAKMVDTCFQDRTKFTHAIHRMSDILERLVALPQVTIACVDGACRLGGQELALACDIVVAGQGATFTDGHLGYDAMPGGGATKRLPNRMGYGRALLYLLESPVLNARDAFNAELVDELVPEKSAASRAEEIAQAIAKRDTSLVQDLKSSLRAASPAPVDKSFLTAFQRSVIDRLVPGS